MDEVANALRRYGLLLQQDKTLPSVVGIIAGESLSSSWWSHPKAHAIFAVLERLSDSDDVLVSRLVAGKVTYVHERLWPAFLAVAMSNEPWQRAGLSAEARALLKTCGGAAGSQPAGTLPGGLRARRSTRAKGEAVRELQQRLLVAATEVHTESGATRSRSRRGRPGPGVTAPRR